MKIIDSIWFASFDMLGVVGVVMGEDDVTGEKKAYIGNAPGTNEQRDAERIAETGAKLTPEIAEKIAKFLNGADEQ